MTIHADGVGDLGEHFRAGRGLAKYAAAVVRDDDRSSAGLGGLLRAAHGHDALDDERHGGVADDLCQLLHGLAAGRRRQIFQEGDGLTAAKAFALSADVVGMSGNILRYIIEKDIEEAQRTSKSCVSEACTSGSSPS